MKANERIPSKCQITPLNIKVASGCGGAVFAGIQVQRETDSRLNGSPICLRIERVERLRKRDKTLRVKVRVKEMEMKGGGDKGDGGGIKMSASWREHKEGATRERRGSAAS